MKEERCSTGNAEVEENFKIYNEWTPRRPWKERKRMAKARENIASKMCSQIQEPELIFYGRHSGVVGLSKLDVYRTVNDLEISQFGYDKVDRNIYQSSCVSAFFLVFSCKFNILYHDSVFAVFCIFSAKSLPSSWNLLQVLVDAECTHDGSIKHIQKFEQWGWTTISRRVLDAERTDDLTVLQVYICFYLHELFFRNFTFGDLWCLLLYLVEFSDYETEDFTLVCLEDYL